MDTVNPSNRWARLIKRRTEIAMTLRHVELERCLQGCSSVDLLRGRQLEHVLIERLLAGRRRPSQ